jgi:hypothetical protein
MVAIQSSAATTTFKEYVAQFERECRPRFRAQCPQCPHVYDVYYGPLLNAADAQLAFAQRMESDHSTQPVYHQPVFTVEESFTSSRRKEAS